MCFSLLLGLHHGDKRTLCYYYKTCSSPLSTSCAWAPFVLADLTSPGLASFTSSRDGQQPLELEPERGTGVLRHTTHIILLVYLRGNVEACSTLT